MRIFFASFARIFVIGILAWQLAPRVAQAGGTEFPGDGPRNLGRGGAGMARADDPSVMIRNPALLADLWGDQALLGAHLLLVDSCFQAAGAYGIGVMSDYYQLRDQKVVQGVPDGSTLFGQPLIGIEDEPYAKVCFEGAAPFLPQLALAMKPASNLGVGIGFFPPETSQLNQWGNRDGTVDTPYGLRPNPLRYALAHLNVSYFSALAAVGWRPADWIRVGFGLQWQLVVLQARTFAPAIGGFLKPSEDVRADLFARDLFVPGVIGSIHITPFDALDIAIGAKWSDRIQSSAKLDLTSGAFGTGEALEYMSGANGMPATLKSTIPTTVHNQSAELNASPIWVPQLSAGIRFADRLKPRVDTAAWDEAAHWTDGDIEDSMQNERWDIELDVIYYLTSWQDRTDVVMQGAQVNLRRIGALGQEPDVVVGAGDCIKSDIALGCLERRSRTVIKGRDQITARLGGDYNILPGLFTVRAGGSYETDGQDPSWMVPIRYMSSRIGVHAGFTVRIAGKTDLSVGFAHFIQKEVRLHYNALTEGSFRPYEGGVDPGRYHLEPGGYDGTAEVEIPNSMRETPGPNFVNVGSFYYNLDVLSASLVQHF